MLYLPAPVGLAQSAAIDLGNITLPTDLVAPVVKQADGIFSPQPASLSTGLSDDGDNPVTGPVEPANDTGNVFSGVAAATTPNRGDSGDSAAADSVIATTAGGTETGEPAVSAGNVFSDITGASVTEAETATGTGAAESDGTMAADVPRAAAADSGDALTMAMEPAAEVTPTDASVADTSALAAAATVEKTTHITVSGDPGTTDTPGTSATVSNTLSNTLSSAEEPVSGNIVPETTDAITVDITDSEEAAKADKGNVFSGFPRTAPDITGPDESTGGNVADAGPASKPDLPQSLSGLSMAGPTLEIPSLHEETYPVAPQQPAGIAGEDHINEDEVILEWATAWSDNDTETYLSFYADGFVPPDENQTREEWERSRRKRLQNQDIRIIVSNADVHAIRGDIVEVRFTQRYTSRSYKDRVVKSIEMVHTDAGWKFLSERVIEELPFQ